MKSCDNHDWKDDWYISDYNATQERRDCHSSGCEMFQTRKHDCNRNNCDIANGRHY